MAINTLAPQGLLFSRNVLTNAPTFQANSYTMLKSYATKIGLGDVVSTGTAGNLGYVTLSADGAGAILGVFAGVEPYYDLNLQQTVFTQWWTGTQNPSADAGCKVIDDPNVAFRAQVSGGPAVLGWRGKNIDWTYGGATGGNGAPNIAGISTLGLNGASVATTNTLPFRVMGVVGITGGPQDPANTNPWIEVVMNPGIAERGQSLGI